MIVCGCAGSVSAPKAPDGSKTTVVLLLNAGIEDEMKEPQKADRSTLGTWLDKDLAARLNKGGYVTGTIRSAKEFSPAPGLFMAVTDIDEYHSNDAYSEQETRLGEGVATIGITVELFQGNHTLPTMRQTDSVVCTRDWQTCAGELNQKMAKAISGRINELYGK
jgi:hypothetical protein